MEPGRAIELSGLLRVILSDERVGARLRGRRDWQIGLRRNLVRLRDPFPLDVHGIILSPDERAKVPLVFAGIPRLGGIGSTDLFVAGIEVQVQGRRLTRSAGGDVVPLSPQDLIPARMAMTPAYPVPRGSVALTLFVPLGASAAEWKERLASCWADIQIVQEAQRKALRATEIAETKQQLLELKKELARADVQDRQPLLHLVNALNSQLEELTREPQTHPRVRTDLPCRELAWLREFLGKGKTPTEIAADWEDRVEAWTRSRKAVRLSDPVLEAARAEWFARTSRRGPSGVDSATVERSLKRWLGRNIGPLTG